MKNEISSLELYYLMKEFKIIEGSKIDRVYHPKNSPKELTIVCHITGQGKSILKVVLPSIILLDDTKDSSDTQTGFGMMLRKYIEGFRIVSIAQRDFERVITINIEGKGGTERYTLIVELFSKGNVIFCDNELKILNTLEEQVWKDRTIKRGEKYVYPKSKINILKIGEKEFAESLKMSDKESLVKSLAITFNLGGKYSEELCAMSGIDKNVKANSLKDEQCSKIYKNLILLLHEEISANSCDGEIFPFILESMKAKEKKTYESFNDAIRENYNMVKHTESKKDLNKNIEKIQKIIDEQLKLYEECEQEYSENQAKGELIYEKYQEIEKIIESVKEARKKYSWKAIKQKLDENPEMKKIIKDIDEKNNSVIIEIEK
jgi:predicted ribosome quality control (RQC) complex YloA/Tae2 family protein